MRLHSQAPSVNNVPNNYVTVSGLPCEKVSPPSPAVLQYANEEKLKSENWILYGAGPGYCSASVSVCELERFSMGNELGIKGASYCGCRGGGGLWVLVGTYTEMTF